MTLFGKSRKRKVSEAKPASYKASLTDGDTLSTQRSPPPAYQPLQQSNQHLTHCPYNLQPYPSPHQAQWQSDVPYRYGPKTVAISSSYLPPGTPSSPPNANRQLPVLQQAWTSCANIAQVTDCPMIGRTVGYLNRGAALYDLIGDKFNDVINLIDDEAFSGNEGDLVLTYDAPTSPPLFPQRHVQTVSHGADRLNVSQVMAKQQTRSTNFDQGAPIFVKSNVFLKATMYANSYLPPQLPPFRVYMPTWPLLCLAAQYSRDAYQRPQGQERDTFIDADCRLGTKAMVLKSVPIDDMNTVVLAIRGSKKTNFMDWAVNLRTDPTTPIGFLDDPGNLCHGGFLDVARRMIKPVAARLRQLLEENPSRASFSLLLTGHSAGGAVAALLYAHMLSESVKSELSILTGCFKRIHMVSFGAPPVTLLPLTKPLNGHKRLQRSIFLSFINEGDPITRIEKPAVKNLLELYSSPAPKPIPTQLPIAPNEPASMSRLNLNLGLIKKNEKRPKLPARPSTAPAGEIRPVSNVVWPVPPATLCNAGRCVVLRVPRNGRQNDVRACITTDDQLRNVIFGDVMMHMMDLYARRIETLAKQAVTAGFKT